MSYKDLAPFIFTFDALLKTREQIKAIVQIVVGGTGDFALQLFIPFLSMASATQEIRQALEAEAASVVNRWALQFSSAEDALDPDAYESLASQLRAIASPAFVMRRVIVQQIIPLSDRIPEPTPPPPPQPTKQSRAEKIILEMREMISTLDDLRKYQIQSEAKNKDLWDDPWIGDLLRNKFEDLKGSILDGQVRV